jgi:hypothetical protein
MQKTVISVGAMRCKDGRYRGRGSAARDSTVVATGVRLTRRESGPEVPRFELPLSSPAARDKPGARPRSVSEPQRARRGKAQAAAKIRGRLLIAPPGLEPGLS